MIYICNANYMPKWRKLYIMTTYMLPHLMYGSASFILTSKTLENMDSNVAYKKLKAIFFSMVKKML